MVSADSLAIGHVARDAGDATPFLAMRSWMTDAAARRLMKLAGADRVALLKLDIEGSEIDVLGGAGPDLLRRFDQITAEFHDFCGITPRPVVRETVRKVRDAGFHVFYFDRDVYRYADVLFVNRRRMSSLRYAVEMARLWGPRVVSSAWRRITGRNPAPPMKDSEAA